MSFHFAVPVTSLAFPWERRSRDPTDGLFADPFGNRHLSFFDTPAPFITAPTRSSFLTEEPRALRSQVITNDEKIFQVALDVPGVKPEDIDVSVHDGVLTIKGERSKKTDNSSFTSKFYQRFSLDDAVVPEQFKAGLANGVLTLTAPKDPSRLEKQVHKVAITSAEPSPAPAIANKQAQADPKVSTDTETVVAGNK